MVLPVFGYAQQEEPKRVKVVVLAAEIAQPAEIVQLPATNMPIAIGKTEIKPKTVRRVTTPQVKHVYTKPLPIERPVTKVKEKAPAVVKNEEPAKVSAPVQRKEVAKSAVVTLGKANQPVETAEVLTNKPKDIVPPETPIQVGSQAAEQAKDKVVAIENSEVIAQEVTEVNRSIAPNALSYIWIGVFLVLAGLVLGLLFGKAAFLVSFAGVVFLVLGFLI